MDIDLEDAPDYISANPVLMFATSEPEARSRCLEAGPDHLGHWPDTKAALNELDMGDVVGRDGLRSDGKVICLIDFSKGMKLVWRSDCGYMNH